MNVQRRCIGVEDVSFDSLGSGEVFTVTNSAGQSFSIRKVNASHVPLTVEARSLFNENDNITDVNAAIMALVEQKNNIEFATIDDLRSGVASVAVAPKQLLQLTAGTASLGLVTLATDDDITNHTGTGVVTSGQAGLFDTTLPIGFGPIPWYFSSVPNSSWAFANGTKLPKELYEDFYSFLESHGAIMSTSTDGYDSRVHFGYSAGNIIMPNFSNLFPRTASTVGRAGLFGEETLPNITGSFDGAMWKHAGEEGCDWKCTGAFNASTAGGLAGDSGNCYGKNITFNASSSCSVYGDDNNVVPKNFTVNWIFKVKA